MRKKKLSEVLEVTVKGTAAELIAKQLPKRLPATRKEPETKEPMRRTTDEREQDKVDREIARNTKKHTAGTNGSVQRTLEYIDDEGRQMPLHTWKEYLDRIATEVNCRIEAANDDLRNAGHDSPNCKVRREKR